MFCPFYPIVTSLNICNLLSNLSLLFLIPQCRARKIGCSDARDNQKKVLGNQN